MTVIKKYNKINHYKFYNKIKQMKENKFQTIKMK